MILNGLTFDIGDTIFLIYPTLYALTMPATLTQTTMIVNHQQAIVTGDVNVCNGVLCADGNPLLMDNNGSVSTNDVIQPVDGQYLYIGNTLMVRKTVISECMYTQGMTLMVA